MLVIGAGIVGVAIALRLRLDGRDVLLIDRERVAAEASRGNAGALAFSDILPLASPRILLRRRAGCWIRWVRWRFAQPICRRLAPWLFRFWRACRHDRVLASTVAQAAMMRLSAVETPLLLAAADAGHMIRSGGALAPLRKQRRVAARRNPDGRSAPTTASNSRILHGPQAIAELQPGLSSALVAATFVPEWKTVSDPLQVTQALARQFERQGGRIRRAEAVALASGTDGVVVHLRDGQDLSARRVVVAAGAWSHHLARTLSEHIPLETERGYNTTLPVGAFDLKRQLIFGDHGFVVTPLSSGVRVGGAVEFAGLDAPPNFARAATMLAKAKRFMPGLRTEGGTQWMGFRPSLPDSLPAIGPAAADERVSTRSATAIWASRNRPRRRASSPISSRGATPPLDLSPFRPQRFA